MTPQVIFKRFKNPKRSPRHRIVCGCGCGGKLDVYADANDKDGQFGVEIGGVIASREFWREFFGKILG